MTDTIPKERVAAALRSIEEATFRLSPTHGGIGKRLAGLRGVIAAQRRALGIEEEKT